MPLIPLGTPYGGGEGEAVCLEDLVMFGESLPIESGDRESRSS